MKYSIWYSISLKQLFDIVFKYILVSSKIFLYKILKNLHLKLLNVSDKSITFLFLLHSYYI